MIDIKSNFSIITKLFRDSLIINSIYLIMASLFSSILGFLFWIIAARYYSPNDIGITSAIFSGVSLVSMIAALGLPRGLIYYLPRSKNTDKIISSCLTTGLIASTIFSLVFIFGLKIWSPDLISVFRDKTNIIIFLVTAGLLTVSSLICAAFTAGRRSSFFMIKESLYHFIKMFPMIFLVGFGAIGILMSIGIGLLISITIGFFFLFEVWNYKPRVKIDPIIKKMASFSAGNFISDSIYNLPRLLLPIIILDMVDAKSAGYFYIAITMAGLLYGVPQSISSSFLVESSDNDKFWHNVNKSIKFNLLILLPGIILFIIFGHFVLRVFNPIYADNATRTLIILSISGLPLSLVNIYNTIKNAQNKISTMIKMNLFITSFTIILSIFLMRYMNMNIEGAAISYLIANTIGSIIIVTKHSDNTFRLLSDIKNYGVMVWK